MKFLILSVFCLLLSILLCGVYPALSDDEGEKDDIQKSAKDEIKKMFEKATSMMKQGFEKAGKTAGGSWTSFEDSAKENTAYSLQTMSEFVEKMKSQMEDAMKEGHNNFQKMMDKAKDDSKNMQDEAEEAMKQEAESMMDKAKKLFTL